MRVRIDIASNGCRGKEDVNMEYNDKLYFDEFPADEKTGFTLMMPDRESLRHQRERLSMAQ